MALEPYVSYHMVQDLRICCKNARHFLDFGGNFGWYALLAAALGCRVDTFEPVPWFAALIEYTRSHLNDAQIGQRIAMHKGQALGSEGSTLYQQDVTLNRSLALQQRTLVVPVRGELGRAGVDGANNMGTGSCGSGSGFICLQVNEVAVDNLQLSPSSRAMRSCGIKVDVEGFEPNVF